VGAAEAVKTAALSSGPSESFPAFLTNVPPEAQDIAPALRRVLQVVKASGAIEHAVKQLRADQDATRSKLTAINGEIELLLQERQQLLAQLALLEKAQQQRLETLRKELETRMETELAQARQQIQQEQQADLSRQVQAFVARQQQAMDEALQKELELRERELTQLTQEVELETQGIVGRLSRLDVDATLAKSLQQSTQDALARRKAQLEAQRAQLITDRDTRLARERDEFSTKLQQQQATELQRRLTLKEAGLRSAMAEILHKSRVEETRKSDQVRQALGEVGQRHAKLVQQQTQLASRKDALGNELDAKLAQARDLETQRQLSLAQLEEVFHNPHPSTHTKALAWLGAAIPQLPPEISDEIQLLQQRMVALMQKERELEEQRRVLRERQLALQLSREIELQYQQKRLREQQAEQAKASRAEELAARATELAQRGAFDDALKLIGQAQGLNPPPPQLSKLAMMREELLSAKTEASRKAQAAELEQVFNRAMQAFETGSYEQAVALFEQVIAQEARGANAAPSGAQSE